MSRKLMSAVATALALGATAAQAADFVAVSRYSEVRFNSVAMGLGAEPYLDVMTDPAATYDNGHEGVGFYVEPGGATDTGMWSVTQVSTIDADRISAQLHQLAVTGTDFGSPLIAQDTNFEYKFTVAEPTTVELTGSIAGPNCCSGTWSRVMLSQGAANIFNTDFGHVFPFTVELQPGITYSLRVDVNGSAMFDATSESSAEATLSIIGDADEDGVLDNADNCTQVANADQRDTNGDGYGNVCDPDLDDNGVVNFVDVGLMKAVIFTSDANADLDGDGAVNFIDVGILKAFIFQAPGPSELVQ
jgi:Thrombospondin type 3 repeat